MLSITNKANYAECSYIKCCYAVCYYAECRGAILMDSSTILLRLINILKKKTGLMKMYRVTSVFFPISTDLRFPKKGLKGLKHVCKPSLG